MPEEINHNFIYLHKQSYKTHTRTYLCADCMNWFSKKDYIKVNHNETNIDTNCYICKLPTLVDLSLGGA